MKRKLDEDNTTQKTDQKSKIYKSGDIILIDDLYYIRYHVKSEREIFIRHYVEMKCPFCQKNINQYISMGYDKDPELIKFYPEVLTNHLNKEHSDNFIAIKKSIIDLSVKCCELLITKKVVL